MKAVMFGLVLVLMMGCSGKEELPPYIEPYEELNDVDLDRMI